jgi:hypothetical protein
MARQGGRRSVRPPSRRARNPWWLLFFVVLVGALLGMVIAEALAGYSALSFLSRDISVGVDPPFTLDLKVLRFTIGAVLRLNLAVPIGIVVAIWILRLLQ